MLEFHRTSNRQYNSDISIDSICSSAKGYNKFPNSEMFCTKTLYNYLDAGLLEIKNIDLPTN